MNDNEFPIRKVNDKDLRGMMIKYCQQ